METLHKTYNFKNICFNVCIANFYGDQNYEWNSSWHEVFGCVFVWFWRNNFWVLLKVFLFQLN